MTQQTAKPYAMDATTENLEKNGVGVVVLFTVIEKIIGNLVVLTGVALKGMPRR